MSAGIDITYKWLGLSTIETDVKIHNDFWETLRSAKNTLVKDLSKILNKKIIFKESELRKILQSDYDYSKDEKICNAFNRYNSQIDWCLRHGMSLLKKETDPMKLKFTKTISPKNFNRIKFIFSEIKIPQSKWNTEIWRDKISSIFELLVNNSKVNDVEVDSLPKFTPEQANDLIWYLQEALEIIPKKDTIQPTLCVSCKELFYTYDSGTTCDKCGNGFCDGCYDNCNDCYCCSDCCSCDKSESYD